MADGLLVDSYCITERIKKEVQCKPLSVATWIIAASFISHDTLHDESFDGLVDRLTTG